MGKSQSIFDSVIANGINLVLVSLLLASSSQICIAADFFVRTSGDDSFNGRSASMAFRTITKAIQSAGPGDVVFIGGGDYTEACLIDANRYGSLNQWFVLYGDRDGRYTGDPGQVRVRPPARRWAFDLRGTSNVVFFGLTIDPIDSADRYGICLRGTPSCYIVACTFERCLYGTHGNGANALIYQCNYQGSRHGLYFNAGTNLQILQSRFTDSRYSVVTRDQSTVAVQGTRFEKVSGPDPMRGIHAVNGALAVAQCQFQQSNLGIYGTGVSSANINQCQFPQAGAHGIHLTGQNLAVSNCTIDSASQGLMLDASGQTTVLKNTLVTECDIGIVAKSSDYTFQNVQLAGCRIGLHQSNENQLLSIQADEQVQFSQCDYAIYANTQGAAEPSSLVVTQCDLRGNDRGILSYGSRLNIDSCQFGGLIYGISAFNTDRVEIESSQFLGNPSDPASHRYAIRTATPAMRLAQCTISNSHLGILCDGLNIATTEFRQNTISDIEHAAIYVRDGSFAYRGADGNQLQRCQRGIIGQRCEWSVNTASFDSSVEYPILDYAGKINVNDLQCDGNQVGLYCSDSIVVTVDSAVIRNCKRYATIVHRCQDATFTDATALANQNGFYVSSATGNPTVFQNCQSLSNAGDGFILTGSSPNVLANSHCMASGNRYGLVVQDSDLTLTDAMRWNISDNTYGIVFRRGSATLQAVQLENNQIGFHGSDCNLTVENGTITANQFGVVARIDSRLSMTGTQIVGSQYAIYATSTDKPCEVTLSELSIQQSKTRGIYLRDDANVGLSTRVANLQFADGNNAITLVDCNSRITNAQLSNCATTAIYQLGGNCLMDTCKIENVDAGWAVLARGDQTSISRLSLRDASHGIAFESSNSSLTNSTLQGAGYAVYVNGEDTNCGMEFVTIADMNAIGVYRRGGTVWLTNSIIHSHRYGLYDAGTPGALIHDHNLVDALRNYVGTSQGANEVTDPARFADLASGDLHLSAGSPAINAGAESDISIDLEGNERPSFDGFEMGAFEYMQPDGSIKVIKWDEVARQ
ncbi:right-handed parallel beta-helix repeat-containing protein [Stieleria sp. JC731]|uniref:right-handed parallel beta-helix repeat-containing protein n=1 Tax=Pirellulaceae TaxID=2691357 RepID=UPI001E394121|nr:right-handed parallel beta-helix repeat-containing protein [Stieleria sp. JC731]MCC9601555.1 right-handed parallel beta-helix repeat-containing protein [Stieleria sp. JC731]